jgi:diaminopimelate decarboxylase
VKCNPDPVLVKSLVIANNCGFDCASIGEITLVLTSGANPKRIIFANPNKPIDAIKFALLSNITTMTFDSIPELEKIREVVDMIKNECNNMPEVVLRIRVPDDHSLNSLG